MLIASFVKKVFDHTNSNHDQDIEKSLEKSLEKTYFEIKTFNKKKPKHEGSKDFSKSCNNNTFWKKTASKGLVTSYLLNEFLGLKPTSISSKISYICKNWYKYGFSQKKNIKTKSYIEEKLQQNEKTFVSRKTVSQSQFKEFLEKKYEFHSVQHFYKFNILNYINSLKELRECIDKKQFNLSKDKKNIPINSQIYEILEPVIYFQYQSIKLKLDKQIDSLRYQTSLYLSQIKDFITRLKSHPYGSDAELFGEITAKFSEQIQKENLQKYSDLKTLDLPVKTLAEIETAQKIHQEIEEKIKFTNSKTIRDIYENYFSPIKSKFSGKNRKLEKKTSETLSLNDPYVLEKIFKTKLKTLYIVPESFYEILHLFPQKIKTPPYVYSFKKEKDNKLIIQKTNSKDPSTKQSIEITTDHDLYRMPIARQWFETYIINNDNPSNEILNLHPSFITIGFLISLHKKKGIYLAKNKDVSSKELEIINDQILSFVSVPKHLHNLGSAIEELSYVKEKIKAHVPIWSQLAGCEYQENKITPTSETIVLPLKEAFKKVLPSIDEVINYYKEKAPRTTTEEFLKIKQLCLLHIFISLLNKELTVSDSPTIEENISIHNYPILLLFDILKINYPVEYSDIPYQYDSSDQFEKFYAFRILNSLESQPKSSYLNKMIYQINKILDQSEENNSTISIKNQEKLHILSALFFRQIKAILLQKTRLALETLQETTQDPLITEKIYTFLTWRIGFYVESFQEDYNFIFYMTKGFFSK